MGQDLSGTRARVRPLRVEITGVAGSGKTTLARCLSAMSPALQVGLRLSKRQAYRHLVNRSSALLPWVALELPRDRWFSWKETKAIMFMEAWQRALTEGVAPDRDAILFDHGPCFWLTRIREFGPRFMRGGKPEAWWKSRVSRWAGLLDVLIWLDAPDDVLARRIRTRDQDHIVKHESEEQIRSFLRRFRAAFHETAALAGEYGGLIRCEFDSGSMTTEEIASGVLAVIHGQTVDTRAP